MQPVKAKDRMEKNNNFLIILVVKLFIISGSLLFVFPVGFEPTTSGAYKWYPSLPSALSS